MQRTLTFGRHYLEMCIAMLLGMAALGVCSALVVDLPDRAGLRVTEMAVWMTLPMVGWMRYRGHARRPTNEMAASMLLPAALALALLATGAITDEHRLLVLEHTLMFPAMLVAMLLRIDEYTGHGHHATA